MSDTVKKLTVLTVMLVLVGWCSTWFNNAFASPYKHPPTGLVFPDRIAGMVKGKVTQFKDPRLGIAVGYNAPGITNTVYVYSLGYMKIQTAPPSLILEEHFKQVIGDIYFVEKQGGYENVRVISNKATLRYGTNGKHRVFYAKYSYLQKYGKHGVLAEPVQRMSIIYLTGYRNHFVKVRFTYDKQIQAKGEETSRQFFDEIEKALLD